MVTKLRNLKELLKRTPTRTPELLNQVNSIQNTQKVEGSRNVVHIMSATCLSKSAMWNRFDITYPMGT